MLVLLIDFAFIEEILFKLKFILKQLYICILSLSLVFSCKPSESLNWRSSVENAEYLHRSIKIVTDVMVHDIYSPPVASRTYAYVIIAGYEAAIQGNTNYLSLSGQLNDFEPIPVPDKKKEYCFYLASVHAILTVGKSMVSSEEKIESFQASIMKEFISLGVPDEIYNNSISYGNQVADHILAWASKDNYKQTRSLPKFFVKNDDSSWKPTPPSYLRAVEPNWNKIRTFLIDSAQQFRPVPATRFSIKKDSQFYQEALFVYTNGLALSKEQSEIANFWDCNPFKMSVNGHVMFATKKISPGGHWVNITRLSCRKANANYIRSAEAYTILALTIADSFISCWDEKYRSNVVRPETYINQYIDKNWIPLLQTPPFPEYTSGHSVISSASAVVLTKLFGNNFSFSDSTELEFGIPARDFKSFVSAAEEASISRFYGGIHYMPSIVNGMKEGKEIGDFYNRKLKTRRENYRPN